MNKVAVVSSNYDNLYFNLCRGIDLTGGLNIQSGNSIVIKINLCDARTPDTGAITHPLFLDGLLRYLRKNYTDLRVYVVESDATVVLADDFIRWFAFLPVLKKWNAKWINLSKEELVFKKINGRHLKEIPMPKVLEDCFLLSLAKLKINIVTKITCCLKNQFGCLPIVNKSIYHPHIDDVIGEVNLVFKPDFCFVDGIIGMGGVQGPSFGMPINAGIIVAGKDPVAVDSVCAKVLGFNPKFVGHIRKSAKMGIGTMKYTLVGDKIRKIDFEVNKFGIFLFRIGSNLKRKSVLKLRKKWKS